MCRHMYIYLYVYSYVADEQVNAVHVDMHMYVCVHIWVDVYKYV